MTINKNTDLSKLSAEELENNKSEIKDLYREAFNDAHVKTEWSGIEALSDLTKPKSVRGQMMLSHFDSMYETLDTLDGDGNDLKSLFATANLQELAESDYQKTLTSLIKSKLTDPEGQDLTQSSLEAKAKTEELEGYEKTRLDELRAAEQKATLEARAAMGNEVTEEFLEQCFLMSHILSLSSARKKDASSATNTVKILPKTRNLDDTGYSILLDGNPFGFLNKLTQDPGSQKSFLNMPTEVLANLQPSIRLYKVIQELDENGNETPEETMQELIFDSHYGASFDAGSYNDLDRHLKDKNSRGQGVGIKDFTFSFEADNPYAVKKSIKARLSLFAVSFDELLRNRNGTDSKGNPRSYKFADLALKTGGNIAKTLPGTKGKSAADNLNKLNFRLVAIIGWANLPADTPISTAGGAMQDAIYNSFITLNLTPTIHDFKIDDAGRVNFEINYLAYVEDFYDHPIFSIFPSFSANLLKNKIMYKVLNEDCKSDEMAKIKEYEKDSLKIDKDVAQALLVKSLIKNKAVYKISLPWGEVYKFNSQGPYHDYDPLKDITELTPDDSTEKQILEDQAEDLGYEKGPTAHQKDIMETNLGSASSLWSIVAGAVAKKIALIFPKEVNKIGRMFGYKPKSPPNIRTHSSVNFFYVSDLIDNILSEIQLHISTMDIRLQMLEAETPPSVPTSDENSPQIPVAEGPAWAAAVRAERSNVKRYLKEYEKFRLVLGPMTIVNPKDPSEIQHVNLGDIPVSLNYFTSWLADKMKKREKADYSLPKFLNDFFNQCLRDYINTDSCFNGQAKQRLILSQNAVTSYRSPHEDSDEETLDLDEITEYILKQNYNDGYYSGRASLDNYTGNKPLLNISGDRDTPGGFPADAVKRQTNYLMYYASRAQPQEYLQGIKAQDENNGIYHYSIGKDRGIVKTINLQKTEAPGLAELRFEQEGYQGLTQLREVYDVKMNTFANIKAFPGVYIFVDPKGFAPSTFGYDEDFELSKLGIGGYYMIKRSEHSFGPGYANSTIQAQWVAEINADGTTTTKRVEQEGDTLSPAKCTIKEKQE